VPYQLTHWIAAFILLAAASAKVLSFQVAEGAVSRTDISPFLGLLLMQWELILGLWLATLVRPGGSWVAALGTFGVFLVASVRRAWLGEASCGCFGVVSVHPAVVAGLDAMVLSLLLACRPPAGERADDIKASLGVAARLGLSAGVVLACLWAMAVAWFGSVAAAAARMTDSPVTLSRTFASGVDGEPESIQSVTFTLHNWGDEPAMLYGGSQDCASRLATEPPLEVGPGEAIEVRVEIRLPGGEGLYRKRVFFLTHGVKTQKLEALIVGRVAR